MRQPRFRPVSAFEDVAPSRLVDTRVNKGANKLVGLLTKRIQITGSLIPSGATAVSANFTSVLPQTGGYLTVWNCSTTRPVVSTLNFSGGDIVPNGASVPLDATGGVCVFSTASTDLIIDVNGYYAADGDGFFTPVTPSRVFDSRILIRSVGRLAKDETQGFVIAGEAGVPETATAVALNITSVSPSAAGFVTVYPCDMCAPDCVQPEPGTNTARPNLVIVPVAADGSVCLYTSSEVDLVADVMGYISTESTAKYTPTSPFRLTDTRDRFRPELNSGTNGDLLPAGQMFAVQVAGTRGIAADATAVSANLTVVGASGAGYLTVWPCGPQPSTSNVNFQAHDSCCQRRSTAAVANRAAVLLQLRQRACHRRHLRLVELTSDDVGVDASRASMS